MSKNEIQHIQEDEYNFPYHYISQFREKFSQNFNDVWGINYVSTIEFLINKLRSESFQSLVDVGCGDGRLVDELCHEFPEKQIEGIDYSEKAVALAKVMSSRGVFRAIDINKAELQNIKYDCGLLVEVFEHIPPKQGDLFVQSVAKLIKPGGFLFITVPHSNKPVEYKHFRHFTVDEIKSCFEGYFDIVEVIPFELNDIRKKSIDFILSNRLFILNNRIFLNAIYSYYKKHLFNAQEKNCNRIFLKAICR